MFRLTLFGGVVISGPEGPLVGRAFHRRRLALLALLGASPTGVVSRDKVIGNLWPDSDTEHARHLLAVSLYELRKALGEEAILSAGDDLQLNGRLVASDVAEFESAVARGDFGHAAALYLGPFLDGFFVSRAPEFERWAEVERERLARSYAGALEAVAGEARQRGDWAAAVDTLRRLAVHDPFNTRTALALMQALEAAGDRIGALRHARIHETLLREEFGVEPDPALGLLVERLRQEPAAPAPAVAAPAPRPEPPEASLPAPPEPPPVQPAARAQPEPELQVVPAPATPRRWRRRPVVAAAAVLAVGAAGWTAWRALGDPGTRPSDSPRVAVLPFADTSPENYEYLGDGIADELINALAQVPGLRVAARTSSFSFKGKQVDVREIGGALDVEAVVEGSIRKAGDRLHVHVQLVEAEDGYNLWAGRYDRPIGEVFAIQHEIAREVARTLTGEAEPGAARVSAAAQTRDLEAYHLYLKGRYLWNQRDEPRQRDVNLRRSVAYFQRALREDPGYALAYSGLADSYASLAGLVPPEEAYPRAKQAALRALQLDESLAEAHTALGRILVFHEWDWEGAGREYRRAIQLRPDYPVARQWYGMYLLHRGEVEPALRQLRYAQQLDPLSLSAASDLGRALYHARRYEEAVQQFRAVLELDPSSADSRLYLGLTHAEQGEVDASLAEFRRWGELTGADLRTVNGYALAAAGRHAEAERIVRELEAQPGTEVSAIGVALIHAQLGNRDDAFRWLDRAVRERSSFLLFLKVTPRVDPLRDDPRFRRLLNRLGLPADG